MKQFLALLITTLTFFSASNTLAGTIELNGKSLDTIASPLICAEQDKKKKKKGKGEEEEPECE